MFGYDTHREIDPSSYVIVEFDTTDIDKIYYNINTRIDQINASGAYPVRLRFVTRNGTGIISFNDMAVILIYFLPVINDRTLGFLTLGNWDIAQRKIIVDDERNMLEEIISSIFNLNKQMVVITTTAYCATVDLTKPVKEKTEEWVLTYGT